MRTLKTRDLLTKVFFKTVNTKDYIQLSSELKGEFKF